MKVLITGGTGKIGQKLINCLINQGLSIRILSKKTVLNLPKQVEIISGNLLNQDDLLKAVKNINIIVHLAALTHSHNQKNYWQVNTKGTKNLIRAAQKAGVARFIFVSTRAIDPSGGTYSQSKLAAEEAVKNSGINWIILRPAEVYGLGQGEMIGRLIKLVKKSYLVPVITTAQDALAPLYIDDLIGVLEKVILQENLVKRTYTLAGPESFSFRGLVNHICQFYQLKRWRVYCPLFLIKIFSLFGLLVSDQLSRLLSSKSTDISLAQKDLEFKPISFQKGLSLLNDKKNSSRS